MDEQVRKQWARILRAVESRGVVIDSRMTPRDVAARVAEDLGDERVRAFVDRYYYPRAYGEGGAAMSAEEAESLVAYVENVHIRDKLRALREEPPTPGCPGRPEGEPSSAGAPGGGVVPSTGEPRDGGRQQQAAPPGGPEPTGRVARAWGQTIVFGLVGAGLAVLACGMWTSDQPGLLAPVGVTVFSLAAFGVAWASRQAECPRCRKSIEIQLGAGFEGIAYCDYCDDYVRARDDETIVPVPPGFVAQGRDFEVRWDDAPDPSGWVWPWDTACCVCNRPAVRKSTQTWNPREHYGLPGGSSIAVHHCADHEQGLTILYPFLRFRSYDHWKAFRHANDLDEEGRRRRRAVTG